jgi:hypothetical protein
MSVVLKSSRRALLKQLVGAAGVLPLLDRSVVGAMAAESPLVSVDDPAAKALQYTEDASKVSGTKPGSKCQNCAFYEGRAGAEAGPCSVFSGKYVKAAGWCTSWAPQM